MSSTPPERTVPYVVAMHLANCAMQLRTAHERAKDAWQREREELLQERARLLSENVDLKVEQVRFYNSKEELKMVNGDLQNIIEDLREETKFLRLERPLCKEPLHTSAARRVFAIPELLEHVLLQVPHTLTRNDQRGYTDILIFERPVTQLFQLQRVNHRFSATIATSPALQRRMGLLEVANSDGLTTQAAPLFDDTGFIYAESLGSLIDTAIERPFRKLNILLRHRELWPDNIELVGSWTRIKVALQADRLPSRLTEQLCFSAEATGRIHFYRPSGYSTFRRTYGYEIGRETTWGELLQWMFMARKDVRERRKCLEALKEVSPDVFA